MVPGGQRESSDSGQDGDHDAGNDGAVGAGGFKGCSLGPSCHSPALVLSHGLPPSKHPSGLSPTPAFQSSI